MRTRLIPIGNSRGIRLPKPMIEEAQLDGEVELTVRDRAIIIASVRTPREGWEAAARLLHERGEDEPLAPGAATTFDDTEWRW